MNPKRLLIVGGVAGGASCAARARRLSEDIDIVMFERGPYVSFANCGLPYYVGHVIEEEEDLLVASPELFRDRFNIDVRTNCHVRRIRPAARELEIEDLGAGRTYRERYDALVLSPGAEPVKPAIEGLNLPGIFTTVTIPDTRLIIDWINTRQVKRSVIVGGGFIGLEMAENLQRLGIGVTIVEMLAHVMPLLDSEMAAFIHDHLEENGVSLRLGSPVSAFRKNADGNIDVELSSGKVEATDMVIWSAGVRPRTELARAAGLTIGTKGGIRVDEQMRTSDPHIWAVGDAVEVRHTVSGQQCLLPLAGPANRQGRIAADAIVKAERNSHFFRGVQGTAVCGVLGLTIAATGVTEKNIKTDAGHLAPYEKVYIHPYDHAGYYPDAETISLKLIFAKPDGKILGAQAVGRKGVARRIDVIAMAIQKNATVFDLEEAELCYAPQYGSAKDPVNMAGMVAANILRKEATVGHWADVIGTDAFVLDVRDTDEFSEEHFEKAVNIPLNELRDRLDELPKDRQIWVHCQVGLRSYIAIRILLQNGFDARNLSGGYLMASAVEKFKPSPTPEQKKKAALGI